MKKIKCLTLLFALMLASGSVWGINFAPISEPQDVPEIVTITNQYPDSKECTTPIEFIAPSIQPKKIQNAVSEDIVATIDGVQEGFTSLSAAIGAATEGQTVRLLSNVTSNPIDVSENITIDLGEHTVTLNSGNNQYVFKASANVTIQNGVITSTFISFKNNSKTYYVYPIWANSGTLTLNDVTITGGYYALYNAATQINLINALGTTGCSSGINNQNSSTTISFDGQYSNLYLNDVKGGTYQLTQGSSLTLNGGTIVPSVKNQFTSANLAAGFEFIKSKSSAKQEVYLIGKSSKMLASVGNDDEYRFASIPTACINSSESSPAKLLVDINSTSSAQYQFIPSTNFYFDFNGHTITANCSYGVFIVSGVNAIFKDSQGNGGVTNNSTAYDYTSAIFTQSGGTAEILSGIYKGKTAIYGNAVAKGGKFSTSPVAIQDRGYKSEYDETTKLYSLISAPFSGNGSGTLADPFQIATKEQLLEINNGYKNDNFVLVADIVLEKQDCKCSESSAIECLRGKLDGKYNEIKHKITLDDSFLFYEFYGTLSNVDFDLQESIIAYEIYPGVLFDHVNTYGNLHVTGNTGVFTIYAWGNQTGSINFSDCINYVTVNGQGSAGDYNAVFVGYAGNKGSVCTYSFTNCINEGIFSTGRAAFFIGNPQTPYTITLNATGCENRGTLRATYVNANYTMNYYAAVTSNCPKMIINGIEKIPCSSGFNLPRFDNTAGNAELNAITNSGVVENGPISDMDLTRNSDGSFRVVGATNNQVKGVDVHHYSIGTGLYASIVDGSARCFATETFAAVPGDGQRKYYPHIPDYKFVDNVFVGEDETYSLIGNKVVNKEGVPYYVIIDEAFFSDHQPHSATFYHVSAFDADNNLLATAALSGSTPGEIKVVNEDSQSEYSNITSAITAANEEETLRLFEDLDLIESIAHDIAEKNLTLATGNHTVSVTSEISSSINLTVYNGGNVVVDDNKTLPLKNLTINATQGESGQIRGNVVPSGNVYYDVKMANDGFFNNQLYYGVAVPFDVTISGGVIAVDNQGTEHDVMALDNNFYIWKYNGATRATSGPIASCWESVHSGDLVPGVFYMMAFDPAEYNI